MKLEIEIEINAPKVKVWEAITNVQDWDKTVSGVEKVEVLEQPSNGLLGLKWRETRTLFGKTATEVMWVTEATDQEFYETRAENHGAVYITRRTVKGQGDQSSLIVEFSGQAQSMVAKIMSAIMSPLFKGATKKALLKDLEDLKNAIESEH